jgi:hypothetical protein
VLPSLSNIVIALANGKLQSQVASCARVRGGSRQGEGNGKGKARGRGRQRGRGKGSSLSQSGRGKGSSLSNVTFLYLV